MEEINAGQSYLRDRNRAFLASVTRVFRSRIGLLVIAANHDLIAADLSISGSCIGISRGLLVSG